jgi:hypothetical protein
MLLWPRKSLLRGWRLGKTKLWMMAHLWLGLLTLPLLLLHGGFHFNLATSTLAAVLMWLVVIVVGSGVFGLVVQNVVPRLMLERVPAETIYSQIDHVLGQYRSEAERLVDVTCGRSGAGGPDDKGRSGDLTGDSPSFRVAGSVRQVGRVQGKVVDVGIDARFVPESEALLTFFTDQVEPYLRAKSGTSLPLGSSRRAEAMFRALKTVLRLDAHPVLDRLADFCDQRRQFDLQTRLHGWLFTWLSLHVALSVALLLLMAVHVVLALKFI